MRAIADLSTAGTEEERKGFIVFDTFRWRGGGQGGRDTEKLMVMEATNRGLGFSFCQHFWLGAPIPGGVQISKVGSKNRSVLYSYRTRNIQFGSTPIGKLQAKNKKKG